MKKLFLTLFALYVSLASAAASDIKIVEVFPNTTDDKNLEYIKLYNFSREDIDITGYQISDLQKSYIFPEGSIIESGSGFVLTRPISKIILNNSDESLTLKDGSGSTLDEVTYSSSEKGVALKFHEALFDAQGARQEEDGGNAQEDSQDNGQESSDEQNSVENSEVPVESGDDAGSQSGALDEDNTETISSGDDEDQENFSASGTLDVEKESQKNSSQDDENSASQNTFPVLFNLQQPSYISFSETLSGAVDVYVCDASRDVCKVNFDFRTSFTGAHGESDYSCTLRLSFSGAEDQAEKCNPNTIEIPEGEHEMLFEIFEKDSGARVAQKSLKLVFSPEAESSSVSTSDSDSQDESEMHIFIYRPEIIIQSGLDGSGRYFYCQKSPCKINLKYEPRHKLERCWWKFYPGEYVSKSTREKCNPGYVTFPEGVHELYLEVYQKDNKTNKTRLRFYVYNDGTKFEDMLPVVGKAWKKGFGSDDVLTRNGETLAEDTALEGLNSSGSVLLGEESNDPLKESRNAEDIYSGELGDIVFQGGETKSKTFSGGVLHCSGVAKCYVNLDYSGKLGENQEMRWYIGDRFFTAGENPKGVWLEESETIYAEILSAGTVVKSFESRVELHPKAKTPQAIASSKTQKKSRSTSLLASFNILALKYDGLRFSGKAPIGSQVVIYKGSKFLAEGFSNEKGKYRVVFQDYEVGNNRYTLEVLSPSGALISRLYKSYTINSQVTQYWKSAPPAAEEPELSLAKKTPTDTAIQEMQVRSTAQQDLTKYYSIIVVFVFVMLGVLHLLHELSRVIGLFHLHPILHRYQTKVRYKVILLL